MTITLATVAYAQTPGFLHKRTNARDFVHAHTRTHTHTHTHTDTHTHAYTSTCTTLRLPERHSCVRPFPNEQADETLASPKECAFPFRVCTHSLGFCRQTNALACRCPRCRPLNTRHLHSCRQTFALDAGPLTPDICTHDADGCASPLLPRILGSLRQSSPPRPSKAPPMWKKHLCAPTLKHNSPSAVRAATHAALHLPLHTPTHTPPRQASFSSEQPLTPLLCAPALN